MPMAIKHGKVTIYYQELPPIKPLDNLMHVVSKDHVTNKNHYISTAAVLMAV